MKEIYRKAFHLTSLCIPFFWRYGLDSSRKSMIFILLPLTLLALAIEIARIEHPSFKKIFYGFFGEILRRHEISEITGATYLLSAAMVCIAFLPKDIAFCALAFLSIGDAFAALIGKRFGKRRLLNSKKTLEGFLACFVSTSIFALFYLPPHLALIGSLSASLAEISAINLDDNLKIPLISGILMSLAYLIT